MNFPSETAVPPVRFERTANSLGNCQTVLGHNDLAPLLSSGLSAIVRDSAASSGDLATGLATRSPHRTNDWLTQDGVTFVRVMRGGL